METKYSEKDLAELKSGLEKWSRAYLVEVCRAYVERCGGRVHFGREVFEAIKKQDWPDEKKNRYTNTLKLLNAGRPYEEVVDAFLKKQDDLHQQTT